jgi:16S rRNA processing protein RimM
MPTRTGGLAFFIFIMQKKDCYLIGYISKTHGLKGEVTVILSEPVTIASLPSVYVEIRNNLVPYFIESFSERPDKVFIKFEEVQTAQQASALKGCGLFLSKENRPRLTRGNFYNDEVIGFEVTDEKLGLLGVLQQVMQSGPNQLLQIHAKGKEILIPVNSPFIRSVNKSKKTINVLLPDGYLDI